MISAQAFRTWLREIGELDVRGDDTSWAAFSPCERYRYALGRSWGGMFCRRVMTFCAHNPSVATHERTDPTLGKMIHFAKREDCDGLVLVNVMAYRATDKAKIDPTDPTGPLNDRVLGIAFSGPGPIVVAWGKLSKAHAKLAERVPHQPGVLCLGTNKDGTPHHPLYMANDTPLVSWT